MAIKVNMPALTLRNIPEETHRALRARAARHGRSMEAEVRAIQEETVRPAERLKIGSEIHRIASEVGFMDDLLPLGRIGKRPSK